MSGSGFVCVGWAAWRADRKPAGRRDESQIIRDGQRRIVSGEVELELRAREGGGQFQFEGVGVIACVELAKQEAGIRVVRRFMIVSRAFEPRAGMRVQAQQPREHEAKAQHPDGGLTRHSGQLSTAAKAGSPPRVARRHHRRCRCA